MFQMNCTNKGCGQFQQPYIDPTDNKVYCSLCNKEIVNVSSFTKTQMKSMKQFKQKNTTSFAVRCDKCGQQERPILSNGDIFCGNCKKPLDNLSLPFKNMLKEKLSKSNPDD